MNRYMSVKDWIIVGLVLFVGLTGALWLRARDARMRAEGARDIQMHAADSLRANSDSLRAVADSSRNVKDSVIAAEDPRIAAALRERDRAVARANAAESRIATINDGIVTRSGPDSVVVRVAVQESTDSILKEVVAPLRFALTRADSVNQSLTRENTSLRESAARTEAALAAAESALNARIAADESLEKSRPGWLTRNLEKAAYALGGGLIGYFVGTRVP